MAVSIPFDVADPAIAGRVKRVTLRQGPAGSFELTEGVGGIDMTPEDWRRIAALIFALTDARPAT